MRMTELTIRRFVPLTAVALLSLAACGGDKTSVSDTSAVAAVTADSALSPVMRDSVASVEIVPPAASTAEAPLVAGRAPVPAPAPTTSRPKPAPSRPTSTRPSGNTASSNPTPAPAAASSGTISSGTSISVTNGDKVCSNALAVGDRVTATTNSVIGGSNGVSIPAGARVGLVVTDSKTSSRQGDEARLAFDVRSITFGGETYTASGTVSTDAVVTERKGGDGKKVAIGAAAGAVIGNIIGGGSRAQRTVVGAAAGGAAGAVAAAVTGDRFACLPAGAALTVQLGNALTVKN